MLVAGIDTSTQSCKVVIADAASGKIVRQGAAKHPDQTEVDPKFWISALKSAVKSAGGLRGVDAISVGGQQHGCVCLDAKGRVIRPAMLWNDTKSAQAAADLVKELGPKFWAKNVFSVPVASFTVTKLRWLAQNEPASIKKLAAVCLPHDYISWILQGAGESGGDLSKLFTDRSDASGTGYFNSQTGKYLYDVLDAAVNKTKNGKLIDVKKLILPRIVKLNEAAGSTPEGIPIAAGSGDNAAAAFALGLHPGEVCISLGTSGVVSGISKSPIQDETGTITGFASLDGNYLPLCATINATRVTETCRKLLDVSYAEFDKLALSAPFGSGGLTLIPYFEGERTPNRPNASGTLFGISNSLDRAGLARAAIEGVLLGQRDGLNAFAAKNIKATSIILIGGGAKSLATARIAPSILMADVSIPEPAEYVALGAAKQAAWMLTNKIPQWKLSKSKTYRSAIPRRQSLALISRYSALSHLPTSGE